MQLDSRFEVRLGALARSNRFSEPHIHLPDIESLT
jgi:hypothetical protein